MRSSHAFCTIVIKSPVLTRAAILKNEYFLTIRSGFAENLSGTFKRDVGDVLALRGHRQTDEK